MDTHDRRILLVDDEEDIRDVLSISLADMGFDVTTADNGRNAIECFRKNPFPIVLTDIKMPVMDGIALLKEIKRISPTTEIIMVTGHGDMDLAIESFRHDAVEFITKPVDVRTLQIAVNRAREKADIKQKLSDYTQNLERLVLEKTDALKRVTQKQPAGATSLTALMDRLPLLIFLVDRSFTITASNALFNKVFGDGIGLHCHTHCRQTPVPCSECPALKTFTTKSSSQAEVAYTTMDAPEPVSYLAWTAPVSVDSESDTVSEVMIMATDISRIVDIQDHLASLGLMVGSVSHGIKGLLTGLDGGVYVLDSALEKHDQDLAMEGLDMVRQTVSKIRKMIMDILFYAKERDLKKELISAKQFISDLIRLTSSRAQQNGISLTSNLPAQDVEFYADAGVLHSAFTNIVENAIDACIEDTEKNDHAIAISFQQEQDQVFFAIKDNGIGMSAQDISKAFTLFHSGKGKKGTGLGLFIAEKSIRQHNGRIWAESEKNRGTTMHMVLPVKHLEP